MALRFWKGSANLLRKCIDCVKCFDLLEYCQDLVLMGSYENVQEYFDVLQLYGNVHGNHQLKVFEFVYTFWNTKGCERDSVMEKEREQNDRSTPGSAARESNDDRNRCDRGGIWFLAIQFFNDGIRSTNEKIARTAGDYYQQLVVNKSEVWNEDRNH